MFYLIDNATGTALAQSRKPATFSADHIDFAGERWLCFTNANASVIEAAAVDFAPGKYKLENGALVLNAAYVPPTPPAPVVPEQVAMWQARDAMIDADLLDDVEAAMAAIPDAKARKKAQQKFEYSNNMRRDDPLLKMLAPSLGLSEAQIDALFIAAAKKV
ncbi:MAG TPA: hypothetical protein VGU61_19955 [Noviherbaspirillum sp.]|jgi:hypothetical protein|uniref:hypothetical protein n=1 Tax=Noviherbaspirillum sp. TaxID=1926288 RepID=UPI002DDD9B5E|nr:hypothetical protein [Noviherbaspirillum sp.]HEV2612547.1 hypothetical protein [Noviherbaspirillum sp.]